MNSPKRRLFILLADDSRAQCKSLTALLEQAGHDVHFVHSGEEAVAFCQKHRPDLILLDLDMPGIGGAAAVAHLRQSSTRYWVPLLLMSADTKPQTLLDGLEAGADDVLAKPIEPALLLAKVQAFARIIGAYPQINADAKRLADYFEENEYEQTLAAELIERLSDHDPQHAARLQQYHRSQNRFYSDVVSLRQGPDGEEYFLLADFQREGLPTAICAYSLIEGLNQLISQHTGSDSLLGQLNDYYVERFGQTRPVRFLLGHSQPHSGMLSIWNGEMDGVLLVSQDGRQWLPIPGNASRLGSERPEVNHCARLRGWQPGDQLIILTLNPAEPQTDSHLLTDTLARLASEGPLSTLGERFAATPIVQTASRQLTYTLTLYQLPPPHPTTRRAAPMP